MPDESVEVHLNELRAEDTLGSFGENPDKKTPFKVYVYENLLDKDVVSQLRAHINSMIKLKSKDNDLYKFKQSEDFKTEIPARKLTPLIHEFIDVMLGEVRQHLEKTTGKKLSEKNFDITASRYDCGDYLLCHNDDIREKFHGRSLAFVFYLNTRAWTKEDGGALALFESDSAGEPVEISNRIWPRPNTLVVFDTSATSWHSVEEVYCKNDFRLSINGWFHTDSPAVDLNETEDEKTQIETCPCELIRPIVVNDRLERFFKECIKQDYLMENTCKMIRKRFKRKSEINLTNFLVPEKFKEICVALKEFTNDRENLKHVGPYNKRNYHVIKADKLPQICQDLYDAFRSELFFMMLARLTGLDLQPPSLMLNHDEKSSDINLVPNESNKKMDNEGEESESSDESSDEESESDETGESSEEDEDEEDEEEDDDDDDDENNEENESEKPVATAEIMNIDNNGTTTKRKLEEATTSRQQPDSRTSSRKRKRISDPLARLEFRHLEGGSYSLIHDHGFELGEKSALDVILHFNHDFAVNFEHGGYISYIDGSPDDDLHDMDYELLTVEPKSNCLSLVYRCDPKTCRFMKHITKSHPSSYQDLYCVYYERPEDLPQSSV